MSIKRKGGNLGNYWEGEIKDLKVVENLKLTDGYWTVRYRAQSARPLVD